jgi:hypothetical protein
MDDYMSRALSDEDVAQHTLHRSICVERSAHLHDRAAARAHATVHVEFNLCDGVHEKR